MASLGPQWVKKQAGKLKLFGTRPNWTVFYIACTKFNLPRPVFHLPSQIFTRIGKQASASFPVWEVFSLRKKLCQKCTWQRVKRSTGACPTTLSILIIAILMTLKKINLSYYLDTKWKHLLITNLGTPLMGNAHERKKQAKKHLQSVQHTILVYAEEIHTEKLICNDWYFNSSITVIWITGLLDEVHLRTIS